MTLVILDANAHRDADFNLDAGVLPALWAMEDRHFWHAARNGWILDALRASHVGVPARVLDVGCGSGAVARALVSVGYRVTGVDTAAPLVEKAHARCPTAEFFVGRLDSMPAGTRDFDAVTCCDVLEHLDSPEELLASAIARARPGGTVLATVPASMALYTVLDELGGHKRRYEAGEIAASFARVGLVDVREHGIFRLTRGIQALVRRKSSKKRAAALDESERRAILRNDVRVPSFAVNLALRALCELERAAGLGASRNRLGASILVVGTVPGVERA